MLNRTFKSFQFGKERQSNLDSNIIRQKKIDFPALYPEPKPHALLSIFGYLVTARALLNHRALGLFILAVQKRRALGSRMTSEAFFVLCNKILFNIKWKHGYV